MSNDGNIQSNKAPDPANVQNIQRNPVASFFGNSIRPANNARQFARYTPGAALQDNSQAAATHPDQRPGFVGADSAHRSSGPKPIAEVPSNQITDDQRDFLESVSNEVLDHGKPDVQKSGRFHIQRVPRNRNNHQQNDGAKGPKKNK